MSDGAGVAPGRVVMVGALRGELDVVLRERFAAVPLDELDARAAAEAAVAVTSGVWGVRGEHLDRMPAWVRS